MSDQTSQDAAAIVRRLRADERWIAQVASCEMRIASQWRRTPEAIERRRGILSRQFPGQEITAERFSELAEVSRDNIARGWDAQRVYSRHDYLLLHGRMNHRVWNGTSAIAHENYGRAHYALRNSPAEFFSGMVTSDLGWPAVGPVDFWFTQGRWPPESFWGLPESFVVTGRQTFSGIECDVLESTTARRKFYVGVSDGRLYGSSRSHDSARMFEYRFTQHAEVASGYWMPGHIEYDVWSDEGSGPHVPATRILDVEVVRVNEPIEDHHFHIEMLEGVEVIDGRGPVPLFYRYKRQFDPAEWARIVEECTKQHDQREARQAALKSNIGRTPAAFPKTRWFNSPPLTWEQLRGRIVLLHFFDTSPRSRHELPLLANLHHECREKLTIVGVYMPTERHAIVQKIADEQGYPICIDVPTDDSPTARGVMANAFAIAFLPYAFIVDENEKVSAHGQADMLTYSLRARTSRAAHKLEA